MRRLWSFIRGLLSLAIVLVLIAAIVFTGLFAWIVIRGMPQREGTAKLDGLTASVRVVRDQNGIANIYASTTEDLFAAQAYVHASERMWQMEVWRRIGAGRLAEIFGESALENDQYIRTLGFRQAAEADWDVMSEAGRTALESYARGVNAWLDQHGDLPLPFVITGLQGAGGGLAGFRPEPWTPIDTLSWQKVQAWSLGGNFGSELQRALLLRRGLSTAQIDQLVPVYDASHPVVVPDAGGGSVTRDLEVASAPMTNIGAPVAAQMLSEADRLRSLVAIAGAGAGLAGSNAVAVAPSRSDTGGALLANDPHLEVSMPSLWYLVGLHCEPVGPECPYELAGAGFPGVPGIVLGHNARIAWGLTNVGPDVQDLFEETLDPNDDGRYMYEGRSLDFEVRREIVRVLSGHAVTLEVRSTVHGVVISDAEGDFRPTDDGGAGLGRDGYVYALAWAATMRPDRTLDSLLAVNRAQNWTAFREALRDFGAPSQTFVYADVDGHIGVQVPGWIPIRAAGDGAYPVPGADGEFDWTGFIPYDELPYSFDPPAGLIVAANNMPAGPGYGHFIGREFDPGFRSARITEMLDAGFGAISSDALRRVQSDVKLTRAAPVAAALQGVSPATDDGELVHQRIMDWQADMECGTGSHGCAAYETFEYWLLRGVFGDELGSGYEPDNMAWRYVGSEPSHDLIRRLVDDPGAAWWDETTTPDTETSDEVMAAALDRAGSDLRQALGDPRGWTWGSIHTITFREQTLGTSGIAPLEWAFNKGPYAAPGSCTTVNKICGRIAGEWPMEGDSPDLQARFAAGSSPSYRLVVDMSDLDAATILQTTGQSGVPFDGHYGDFIARWLSNTPLLLPWSDDAVDDAARQTLTLEP